MIKQENSFGKISITDEVFANLAGEAATSCFGVKGMVACSKEGGPLSAASSPRRRLRGRFRG